MTDETTTPADAPVIQEFPKMLYHADGVQRIVASRDEQDAAGSEWHEAPVEPIAKADPPPAAAPPPTDSYA